MGLNVLSLFDGMSCGMIALEKAGIKVDNYYASEVDKNAIKVSSNNYPSIIRIGDVNKVSYKDGTLTTENGDFITKIDLLIGGSPCQDFSSARAFGNNGQQPKGLKGDKSSLFYEYLRIKKEIENENTDLVFLLENVRMKKENKDSLDQYLGVIGKLINSELVSYQKRARIYWTNIKFEQVVDRDVSFQNFKCKGNLDKYKVNKTPSRERMWNNGNGMNNSSSCANVTHSDKIYCLTTKQDRSPNSGLVEYEDFCRYLTQRELELAQTVPIGYTSCLSYNQACAVLGNGWTVDVISHIFSGIKEKKHV